MSIHYASGMTGRGSPRFALALNTAARFYSTKLVRNLGATAAVADNTPAISKIGGKASCQQQDLLDAKWWGWPALTDVHTKSSPLRRMARLTICWPQRALLHPLTRTQQYPDRSNALAVTAIPVLPTDPLGVGLFPWRFRHLL